METSAKWLWKPAVAGINDLVVSCLSRQVIYVTCSTWYIGHIGKCRENLGDKIKRELAYKDFEIIGK